MNTVKVFHEGGPVLHWRKMVLKVKVKVVQQLTRCKNLRHEYVRFALTDILSRRVGVVVHKDEGHQHPERICAQILHKMRFVF